MPQARYTFTQFLRDRGEESLLKEDAEPELTGLVLREVKLASAAFLVLVVGVVLVFYQPGDQGKGDEGEGTTVKTAPPGAAAAAEHPSRNVVARTVPSRRAAEAPAAEMRQVAPGARRVPPQRSGPGGAAAPRPEPVRYTVAPGDTLEGISRRFYGTGRYWRLIARLNRIERPEALRVGDVLLLPPPSLVKGR